MTADDLLSSGLDMPLSLGSTLWASTKEGALESFGLGTVLRGATLPREAPVAPPVPMVRGMIGMAPKPGADEELAARREAAGAITEEQYKSSTSFRESIPWDRGMTETRARALAEMDDVRKVREFYGAKRPVTAFMGKLAGSAVDPINYVPIFGEAVAAGNVARFGYIGGRALTASADAMANTAIAALATAPVRSKLGDDVSFQSTVSQIALAGLIGAGFGTAVGVAGARRAGFMADATDRLATLKRTQESRVVLNDAIDSLSRNGRVELSPASHGFIERAAQDVTYASRQGFEEPLRASVGPAEAPRIDDVTGIEGFTVFHGSPHQFDRFSMEHIGKGEGAQAYGHGLYFAQSKGIGESYRDTLSKDFSPADTARWLASEAGTTETTRAAKYGREYLKDEVVIATITKKERARVEAAIALLDGSSKLPAEGGSLYEVRIRANPDDFLDWDRPLSEQSPKVREALQDFDPSMKGSDVYNAAIGIATESGNNITHGGGSKQAGDWLREHGIAGVKYLDAGSRPVGGLPSNGFIVWDNGKPRKFMDRADAEAVLAEALAAGRDAKLEDISNGGSRNFVVFDDSLLHTVRRNDEFIAKQPQDLSGRATAQLVANGYMPEDFIAEPNRAAIESQVGKPDNLRAVAEQYRVHPETGEFPEQAELDQLIAEGRLSEEDAAMLKAADENFTTATAFGDALKAAMGCVI